MPDLNHELIAGLHLRVLAIQRIQAGRWWNFRNVISPFSRLWLVLKGHAVVRHHGQEFRLQPGRMHLVPPFTAHDCQCSKSFEHFYVHFEAGLSAGIDLFAFCDCDFDLPAPPEAARMLERLEELFPDKRLPCFDPAREEYRRFTTPAERKPEPAGGADWLEANGLLSVLLAGFLRTARAHEGVHGRVTRQFLAVQKFIQQNMGRPLLLADLAKAAGLQPTYFSDRFKQLIGVRPLEYLMQRRIERAQSLLLTTPCSVKEVAVEVGLPDPGYFSRVFSRRCGVSPTEYRKRAVN